MNLEDAQQICERYLKKMEVCFKPECRLTLIMRSPGKPDCYLIFTRDELPEVIATIQRDMAQRDVCEHGIKSGDWCPDCNRDYKEAAREAE